MLIILNLNYVIRHFCDIITLTEVFSLKFIVSKTNLYAKFEPHIFWKFGSDVTVISSSTQNPFFSKKKRWTVNTYPHEKFGVEDIFAPSGWKIRWSNSPCKIELKRLWHGQLRAQIFVEMISYCSTTALWCHNDNYLLCGVFWPSLRFDVVLHSLQNESKLRFFSRRFSKWFEFSIVAYSGNPEHSLYCKNSALNNALNKKLPCAFVQLRCANFLKQIIKTLQK